MCFASLHITFIWWLLAILTKHNGKFYKTLRAMAKDLV